jgi:hypothetical protein
VQRSTELRQERIEIDETARRFIQEASASSGELHIVANRRQKGDEREYRLKEREHARTTTSRRASRSSSWRWTSTTLRSSRTCLR